MNFDLKSAFVLYVLSFTACITLTEEQKKQLIKETVVETKLNKSAIYSGTSTFLAKNIGDSKAAIKFSDKEEGKIIARIMRTCDFRNGSVTLNMDVTYNMILIAKDSKYKLTLEPVDWKYNGATYTYPDHIEDMNKCTSSFQNDIKSGIDKASSEKDF